MQNLNRHDSHSLHMSQTIISLGIHVENQGCDGRLFPHGMYSSADLSRP